MSEQCDNYEICEKYGIYGACEENEFSTMRCKPSEKQTINILAEIDNKLSKLLEKQTD